MRRRGIGQWRRWTRHGCRKRIWRRRHLWRRWRTGIRKRQMRRWRGWRGRAGRTGHSRRSPGWGRGIFGISGTRRSSWRMRFGRWRLSGGNMRSRFCGRSPTRFWSTRGENPARRDAPVDRPWRENGKLVGEFPIDWETGNGKGEDAGSLLPVLREGEAVDAAGKVVGLLKSGTGARAIWDVLIGFSGELLMRNPNILTLHAVTTANALLYANRTVGDDNTRRMLLLQKTDPLYPV